MGSMETLWGALARQLVLLVLIVLVTVAVAVAAGLWWGGMASGVAAVAGLLLFIFVLRPRLPRARSPNKSR